MAVAWNGKSWTIACVAVGSYWTSGTTDRTLAESWNGSAWSIVPTAVPAGASAYSLLAVDCPSASVCSAVGSWSRSTPSSLTLAEQRG